MRYFLLLILLSLPLSAEAKEAQMGDTHTIEISAEVNNAVACDLLGYCITEDGVIELEVVSETEEEIIYGF